MSSMFDMQVVKGSGVAMPGDMNLPRPRFAVGTRVSLPTWKNDNLIGMCYRDAMRQMVADYRAHIARWRATGMSDEAVKLAAYECKQKIRFKLQTMRQADSIEVAGHAPQSINVVGMVGRQAFMLENKLSSEVTFNAYLLFRRKLESGTEVVYIHPEALVCEQWLTEVQEGGAT